LFLKKFFYVALPLLEEVVHVENLVCGDANALVLVIWIGYFHHNKRLCRAFGAHHKEKAIAAAHARRRCHISGKHEDGFVAKFAFAKRATGFLLEGCDDLFEEFE